METTDLATLAFIIGLAAILLLALSEFLLDRLRPKRRKARRMPDDRPKHKTRQIVVDGTNVLFWRDNTAQLATLKTVVNRLKAKGYEPVVFLDASTRHHLGNRDLNRRKFKQALGLTKNLVHVVPKGTEADAFILAYARDHKISVVTNDRFRDRPTEARNVKLIKGRFDGRKLILKNL